MRAFGARALSVIALGYGVGCTAITSSDGFEEREPPLECGNEPGSAIVDMRVDLSDMNAHEDNLVIADLVQVLPAARTQVGRVIYDPLGSANLRMVLPCAVRDGNHDVDLIADLSGNRQFEQCDAIEGGLSCSDHQWRLRLQADGRLMYQHDTDFTDIAASPAVSRGALPIRALFRNLGQFKDKLLEVHVRALDDRGEAAETILIYRRQRIPEVDSDLDMLGAANLVRRGERFEIAIWIDTNENGRYDAPSVDRTDRDYATLISGLADAPSPPEPGGLRILFDGNALPAVADVRFPEEPLAR